MRRHTRPAAGLSLLVVLVALAFGCRQEVPPLYRRNQPPETTLTIVPEDSAQGFYRYRVYWRGEDSDGRVVRYIFAITDTLSRNEEDNWTAERFEDRVRGVYTSKTDSVFVFNSARGRQAFNIQAIDDYGRRDPSPARAYFRIVDSGLPRVRFLNVHSFRVEGAGTVWPDTCLAAEPCTIATYTNFKIAFTYNDSFGNGRATGFQWQGIRPGEVSPESFQPYATDSLFLQAGHDTTACYPNCDPETPHDSLWSLAGNTVTVYYKSVRGAAIAPGNFQFRARVRDQARLVSLLSTSGTRRVTLNYDPETKLQRVPVGDCPRCRRTSPPPPAWCSQGGERRAGWIVGMDQSVFVDAHGDPDLTKWILFCEGDTLPQLSDVRFYSEGWDDSLDVPADPSGLREVGFSSRFEWRAGVPPNQLFNGSMPLSSRYDPQDLALPPGYTKPDRGFLNGWGGGRFPGLCPFDFTYSVAAVDEQSKRDGTPDAISFYVSSSPMIDSTTVDPDSSAQAPFVFVLAPQCPSGFEFFCPDLSGLSFGPDTLLLAGEHQEDSGAPPFPGSAGQNRFRLPILAYGHDDPRDGTPPIRPEVAGRIRSWNYRFDCTDADCQDVNLPGEGQWRDDSEAPDVFDDTLQVRLPLDKASNPVGPPFKLVIQPSGLGGYRFSLQGRDTQAIGQTCLEPSDLSPGAAEFPRPVSEQGRVTQLVERRVVVRQLQDVRPYVPPARAAGTGGDRKGRWGR